MELRHILDLCSELVRRTCEDTTQVGFHVKTATNNNGDTHLTRTATMEYRNGDNQFNLKKNYHLNLYSIIKCESLCVNTCI